MCIGIFRSEAPPRAERDRITATARPALPVSLHRCTGPHFPALDRYTARGRNIRGTPARQLESRCDLFLMISLYFYLSEGLHVRTYLF